MKNSFTALHLLINPLLKRWGARRRRYSNESTQRKGSGKGVSTFITPKMVCQRQTKPYIMHIHFKNYLLNLMTQSAIIIYLTGRPGVGKYTIAKELAKKYGFIICDNQLINNPIFELLQYDGYAKIPSFAWDSIGKIRNEIFNFLAKVPEKSYVLTNWLEENDGDRKLFERVKDMAEKRGSLFVPVQIEITREEHLKRIIQPERRARWKSINPEHAGDTGPLLSITHPNLMKIDVSNLGAKEVADKIMNHSKIIN